MSKAISEPAIDVALVLASVAALVATMPARKRLQWMRRMRRLIGDANVVALFHAKSDAALKERYERLLPFLLDHNE